MTAHMEDLANIVGHAGESLGLFPGQLQSMMEALDTRMNETKTLLDSSGQSVHQAMDQCLKEINTFFASMMKQLQNTVSSQQSVIQEACEKSNENMELTARKIREETGNSLESFRESVTVVQNNMLSILEQQNLGHLSLQNELQSAFNGMMGKLENSVSAQQNVIQEVCERTNESTELAIKRIRDETENAAERFAVIIKSLQDNMTSLLERQSDNTLSVQNLVSSTKDVFEKGSTLASEMSNASKLITDTLNKIKDLSGQLTANSETLNLTSDTLKNITQAFGIQSTKLTGIYNEILNQFDLALKEAQKTASEYSMMFPTIRQDLENIVDQLVDGMHKYQETARESLNKTLDEFAENLSEAVTYLQGGIEELADIVEEITESKTKLTSVFTR